MVIGFGDFAFSKMNRQPPTIDNRKSPYGTLVCVPPNQPGAPTDDEEWRERLAEALDYPNAKKDLAAKLGRKQADVTKLLNGTLQKAEVMLAASRILHIDPPEKIFDDHQYRALVVIEDLRRIPGGATKVEMLIRRIEDIAGELMNAARSEARALGYEEDARPPRRPRRPDGV